MLKVSHSCQKRYNFFDKIVRKYNANYLMTAHHGDDLIETILMRITRGSNLDGYSGIHKIVDMEGYKLVRPLIYFTKKELEDYDLKNNVKYFTSKYIDKERDKAINRIINKKTNRILIDEFLKIDKYIQKEILYYVMEDFYQDDLILVNDKHIELLMYLINSNKSNMIVNLPNEILAIKSYNEFYLKRETGEIDSYEIEFNKYAELPNNHSIELIDDTEDNSNNICRLSSHDIKLPITIRTRKFGDKISVKGLNGKKKVKEIFIDNKISLEERDTWPIVIDAVGNILWIPGVKKSKFDIPKGKNCDIILKYR